MTRPAYARRRRRQRILVPLRAHGDKRIDLLVLSHRDNDHVQARTPRRPQCIQAWTGSLGETHPLRRRSGTRADADSSGMGRALRCCIRRSRITRERKPNALSRVVVQDAAAAARCSPATSR
jgi:hypothetical protein